MNISHRRIRSRKLRSRGLTLIETALALTVLALVMSGIAIQLASNATETRNRITAEKFKEVFHASQKYLETNNSDLIAESFTTKHVTADELKSANFLPPSFEDLNPYGQSHTLLIKKTGGPDPVIEALVTSHGGRRIPDKQLTKTATHIGAPGGFVPEEYVGSATPGNIVGVFGGWSAALSDWSAFPGGRRPSTGTLQATMVFHSGKIIEDYLYRKDIGVPEANRMETSIDMNGNDLNNVNEIHAVNIWASDTVEANFLKSTGDIDADGNISSGADISADGSISAGADISAGNNISAAGNLQVGGNANIVGKTTTSDLSSGILDANTRLYNVPEHLRDASGVSRMRLAHLFPKMVAQYSYTVRQGDHVPKPICAISGAERIMIYRQVQSIRTATEVYTTGDSNQLPPSADPICFFFPTAPQCLNPPQPSNSFYHGITEFSEGLFAINVAPKWWRVEWRGHGRQTGIDRDPNYTINDVPRVGVAMTYCYYGE